MCLDGYIYFHARKCHYLFHSSKASLFLHVYHRKKLSVCRWEVQHCYQPNTHTCSKFSILRSGKLTESKQNHSVLMCAKVKGRKIYFTCRRSRQNLTRSLSHFCEYYYTRIVMAKGSNLQRVGQANWLRYYVLYFHTLCNWKGRLN